MVQPVEASRLLKAGPNGSVYFHEVLSSRNYRQKKKKGREEIFSAVTGAIMFFVVYTVQEENDTRSSEGQDNPEP